MMIHLIRQTHSEIGCVNAKVLVQIFRNEMMIFSAAAKATYYVVISLCILQKSMSCPVSKKNISEEMSISEEF